eukprot:m.266241 g.266241  ORF g.266241 m.266241 type:complete len:91 (+) comp64638_c0_seq1:510-782(+)
MTFHAGQAGIAVGGSFGGTICSTTTELALLRALGPRTCPFHILRKSRLRLRPSQLSSVQEHMTCSWFAPYFPGMYQRHRSSRTIQRWLPA